VSNSHQLPAPLIWNEPKVAMHLNLPTAFNVLLEMHLHAWAFCKDKRQFSTRDVPDQCSIGAKRLSAHTAVQTACLYTISMAQTFKWKPHHTASCFPLFITRIYNKKAGQLVSTYSAHQLAVNICKNILKDEEQEDSGVPS